MDKFVKQLFYGLIILITVIHTIDIIRDVHTKDIIMYDDCVNACKYKSYSGYKLGSDWHPDSCFVEQYDRTECVRSCEVILE